MALAVIAARVPVDTSADALRTAGEGAEDVLVKPVGGTIYIGPSGVTAATGFEVGDGDVVSCSLDPGQVIFGITASGTVTVHVFVIPTGG